MFKSYQNIHIINNYCNDLAVVGDIAGNENIKEECFFVCNIGHIIEQYKLWKSSLPRVCPYYAVKCNKDSVVLQVLIALGLGFDCASKSEMQRILSLGVDESRIIFANTNKFISHLCYASKKNIQVMTFDNESELYKIKDYSPKARLLIRIRCEDKEAEYQLGIKFGCNYQSEAPVLLQTAKKLGLDVVGVSFHVGSNAKNPNIYRTAIKYSREVFDYASSIDFHFNTLNIGGGFPGVRNNVMYKAFEVINEALEEFFHDPSIRIIAEPGRFFIASAYTLACSIISHRSIQLSSSNTSSSVHHNMYYITDGTHGSFNLLNLYKYEVTPTILNSTLDTELFSSSVWGPTCDGSDRVCKNVLLPQLKIGNWLVFENMGAYTFSGANNFNGMPKPNGFFTGDTSVWMYLKDFKQFQTRFIFHKDKNDLVKCLENRRENNISS